jgi:hypothetical protein
VFDAIVSNKTFWNATAQPTQQLKFCNTHVNRTTPFVRNFQIDGVFHRAALIPIWIPSSPNPSARAISVLVPFTAGGAYRRQKGTVFFLEGHCRAMGSCYLRKTRRRAALGEAYLFLRDRIAVSARGGCRAGDERRWGVVQPVGHLTVNEDGEGSNPSAPANFL